MIQSMDDPGYYQAYVCAWLYTVQDHTQNNVTELWLDYRKLRNKEHESSVGETCLFFLMIFIYFTEIVPRKCGQK